MKNKILNQECGFEGIRNDLAGENEYFELVQETECALRSEDNKSEFSEDLTVNNESNDLLKVASQISEFQQNQREIYEEFASDFEGLDEDTSTDEFDGYSIVDETNADMLEAGSDIYDEDIGYTSTADYTMIPNPEDDDSVASTSQS